MRTRGFTLAETTVALAIISLLALVVMNLFLYGVRSIGHTAMRTRADNLASSLQADYLVAAWKDLAPGQIQLSKQDNDFDAEIQILQTRPSDGANSDNLRTIRVIVSWSEDGARRQVIRQVWRTRVGQ